jgi:hypothetical protein
MPSDLIRGWTPVRVKKMRQNKNPEFQIRRILTISRAVHSPSVGIDGVGTGIARRNSPIVRFKPASVGGNQKDASDEYLFCRRHGGGETA